MNFSYCQAYSARDQGHTSVPNDIPNGTRSIWLENNNISQISDESFDQIAIDFSYVTMLVLSKNEITHVSSGAFAEFQRLENLYFDNNMIKNITFKEEYSARLETLHIRDNQLIQLPTFYGSFMSLTHIYLTGNLISYIGEDDFDNITNISLVYLSHNRLKSFQPRQELSSLILLYLDNNNLTEIPTFQGTYNSLQSLQLHKNDISLKSLLMLKEKINGLEQSLIYLTLGGNLAIVKNLTAVSNIIKEFPNLEYFNLLDSKISKILTIENNNPWSLDLSGNNITEISKEVFTDSNVGDDFRLTLDNNPIEMLPNLYEYMVDSNSSKFGLSLRQMKFHCNTLCWISSGQVSL